MSKKAALILALVLALSWSAYALAEAPQPAEASEQEDAYFVVADVDTEVRAGSGAGFERLGTLLKGDAVLYLDEYAIDKHGAAWYSVEFNGEEGWVCEDGTHLEYGILPQAAPQPIPAPIASNSIGTYLGAFTVDASSFRPADQNEGIDVSGACAVDGQLTTAWNSFNESANQWIRLSVQDGRSYEIAGLRLAAGYWKNGEVYYANYRPKDIDIYCDGAFVTSCTLSDQMDYQTIWFSQPVTGSSIQIAVRTMYAAQDDRYIYPDDTTTKDCCVTEIELIGAAGNTLSEAAMDDWGAAVQRLRSKLLSGGRVMRGDHSVEVAGLQLLLREGFHVLNGSVDGAFGNGTQAALDMLADRMRQALPNCETMIPGVVDGAYWRNMMAYMALN